MSEPTQQPLILSATVRVSGTASDPEDESLPGDYLHQVELHGLESGTASVLDAASRETIESRVLDCFHEHQGIECLDDFAITVEIEGHPLSSQHGGLATQSTAPTASISPDRIKVDHLGKSEIVEAAPMRLRGS